MKYKVVNILFMGEVQLERQLNDYAKDGWSLVTLLPLPDHQYRAVLSQPGLPAVTSKLQGVKYKNNKKIKEMA
jgi:hypothetical protein